MNREESEPPRTAEEIGFQVSTTRVTIIRETAEEEYCAAAGETRRWFKTMDTRAAGKKKSYFLFGLAAASFAPLASVCFAFHLVLHWDSSFWTISEVLALLAALVLSLWRVGGNHRWVDSRIRAELYKREVFLHECRVGPYLAEADPSARLKIRTELIGDERTSPEELLELRTSSISWRDDLEDAYAHRRYLPLSHLNCNLMRYKDERVVEQRDWYAQRLREVARHDVIWENVGRVMLVGAVVAAIWHMAAFGEVGKKQAAQMQNSPGELASLQAKPSNATQGDAEKTREQVEFFALILPALGGLLISFQNLANWRALCAHYRDYGMRLKALEDELSEFKQKLDSPEPPSGTEADLKFRRLVLEIEELFATEVRQWALLVRSEHAKTGI